MTFDFRRFFTFVVYFLGSLRGSLRRVLIVCAFLLLYPLLQMFIWLFFLVDELLFRQYRQQHIESPVFIVGMFRSGTTFLHRLLDKDDQFSSMSMWEILFSPSVAQRKLTASIGRLLHNPVHKLLTFLEHDWSKKNVMHAVSLRQPEEDEYLLLHRWSAMTAGLSAGILPLASPYLHFDQNIDNRTSIMRFHQLCIKKHLYSKGEKGKRYLAKNPALSPKLASALSTFPDAKIIVLVRSPLEVIPSFLSMMQFSWRIVGTATDKQALRDFILTMARHWYRYPLEVLEKREPSSYAVVNYEELVANPEKTVRNIYSTLQLPMHPEFAQILTQESKHARSHRSAHYYDLEELGLDRETIVEEFADIFQRFGFDKQQPVNKQRNTEAMATI